MSQSPTSAPNNAALPRQVLLTLPQRPFGQTSRKDLWWLVPLLTFIGLGGFVVYSTWAAFQGTNYRYNGQHDTVHHDRPDYLSPMYSPELFNDPTQSEAGHSWFGQKPASWPSWMVFSPALLVLWAPGGFRMTCYYYRGAYYKAFWADPPSCAVGEPRKSYWGENSLPLILQNIHRYFFYLAFLFLFLLAWDAIRAFWFIDPHTGKGHLGMGFGTIVLIVNVCLLSSYALGCHSLRHLIGGSKDELSKSKGCYKAYNCVSCLNKRHMMWAWFSLFWVAFADVYVRLCCMGIWHDWRIF